MAGEAADAIRSVLAAADRFQPAPGSDRLADRARWFEEARAAAGSRAA
jgi:hypothetical protein